MNIQGGNGDYSIGWSNKIIEIELVPGSISILPGKTPKYFIRIMPEAKGRINDIMVTNINWFKIYKKENML